MDQELDQQRRTQIPRAIRIPVVLLSIALGLIVGAMSTNLTEQMLAMDLSREASDFETIQRVLAVEEIVFLVGAVLLTFLAILKSRRLKPTELPPGTFGKPFTAFLLGAALIFIALIASNFMTSGVDAFTHAVYGFVNPCFLLGAIGSIAVAALRLRHSAYAVTASTAAEIFMVLLFFPLAIIGFFLRRYDRKNEFVA